MQKTPFAGLTVLEPGESIYADNSAFIERDRFEIDRELKLGVKTHRHSELAPATAPQSAPVATVIGSGGTISAGIPLTFGMTFQDVTGGETLLGPTQLITTASPIGSPTQQLAAAVNYEEGTLDVDIYTYAFTYLDEDGGETPLSPPVVVTRQSGFANAKITLTGFQVEGAFPDPSIKKARVYRARAGGEFVKLAETETNTYIDNGSVSPDCDTHPPSFNTNTTGGTNSIKVKLGNGTETQFASEVEWQFINLYCSQSGSFDESCLVGQYPVGSGGSFVFMSSLALLNAQPPDVSRSFGTADKIDPDTELVEMHWKRPVELKGELPNDAEEGDVRIVTNEHKAYIYSLGGWQLWNQGGGGGGAGTLDVFKEGATPPDNQVEILDSFDSGELEENWEATDGETPVTAGWKEEGGQLIKEGGGIGAYRIGAVGVGGRVVSKFGGEESFACEQEHLLRVHDEETIGTLSCAYQGGFGHGFTGASKILIQLTGTGAGTWTLEQESFNEPPIGNYWLVSELDGTVVKCAFWTTDPALGGEPSHEIEVDLANPALEPSLEEIAPFREEVNGKFGLQFVGAPGGLTYEIDFELDGAASPDYIADASFIEFREAGSALIIGSALSAAGSGAVVTVPKGGGGGTTIVGSGDIFVEVDEEAEWTLTVPFPPPASGVSGSGLVSVVAVGSSWVVTGQMPTRVTGSAVTGSLIAGGAENLDFLLPGGSADLVRLVTNHKARVRVYGDTAARTADAAREIGTDPVGDHGVQLDYANNLEAGGGKRRLTPVINAANLDEPPQHRVYLRVTNLEATTQTITIAFTYVAKEA